MSRPTNIQIDPEAFRHNLDCIQALAPGKKVMAMVKANAYGCGLETILPVLDGRVESLGVASIGEALQVRAHGCQLECVLLSGVFAPEELYLACSERFQCVVHHALQLQWILDNPLPGKLKVWVKVNTGMNRLGFLPNEAASVLQTLDRCAWIDKKIGLMTHFACADEPQHPHNEKQIKAFNQLNALKGDYLRSMANSAAILSMPWTHADVIRPGLMLYGVSPFSGQTGLDLGLRPVMTFRSELTAIHHYPPNAPIGYAGTWHSDQASIIGMVPVGYGDGYPRHVKLNTPVWVQGRQLPIVGRLSMDMLTVDLTQMPDAKIGDPVELWGLNLPIEVIADASGTIAYELLTQQRRRA